MVQGSLKMYLAVVFVLLLCRFLQYPSTNNVNFIQTKTDFSISVCSKPYTYEIQKFEGYSEIKMLDRLSNFTFWQKWRNMSTMIDSIVINNGSHEFNLNLDDNSYEAQFFIIPTDDTSMAVCNVIDLSPYGMVEILELSYTTEIEIYLHRNGQFLYEFDRKENMITGSSYKNVKNQGELVKIYDFTAYINAEFKSILVHESESFDDCVRAELDEEVDEEMMKCFFTRSPYNNCHSVMNRRALKSLKAFLHETNCKSPNTVLNTNAEFSNGFLSQHIKKDKDGKDVDLFIETITGYKPKFILRFSGMTKLTQVWNLN